MPKVPRICRRFGMHFMEEISTVEATRSTDLLDILARVVLVVDLTLVIDISASG